MSFQRTLAGSQETTFHEETLQ